jgi:iron complex transport system ATP-binding protein
MTSILNAHDLAIGYRNPRQPDSIVARSLELELRRGELVCLLGPNGAGKSTLMRTLTGMQPPLAGQVLLNGSNIHRFAPAELAKMLSIVLTERVDAGNLSAYELVALGRYPYTNWVGRLSAADHAIIQKALRDAAAEELMVRPVNQLSDGERQKVMIARALAQEPVIMLLDEPTAFLDLPRRVEIMHMLRALAHSNGCAILLSTHDLDLALRNADRIWLLAGNGVLHSGAPEDLVFNGAFAATFHSEGVEFDAHSGAFHVHRERKGVVGLAGDALATFWMARALEREGFQIVHNVGHEEVGLFIQAQRANGDVGPTWIVHIHRQQRTCASVAAVLQLVRRHYRTT